MADIQTVSPDTSDPSCASSDYREMRPTWEKIRAILGGLHSVRHHGERYLPKYEKESHHEYKRRLESTAWRPEFEDGVRNLSAKPFQKDIALSDGASEQIKTFAENVDGQGSNLTQFAKAFFDEALSFGLSGILVDYPTMAPGLTLADEKAANAKPYWCMICPENIIAAYFDTYGGEVYLSHLRIKECYSKKDAAFGEIEVERVRVFNRDKLGNVTFEIWESREVSTPGTNTIKRGDKYFALQKIQEGSISLEYIPFVFLFTGKRFGNYRVKPPLNSLADMQIELYQELSLSREIRTFAGSPMLKLLGVALESAETTEDSEGKKVPTLTTGPRTIIAIPPGPDGTQGDADYIQPQSANMVEIREGISDLIENMRRLAMQPITDKAGNPTATGQAIDQAKAHSTLQAWALALKDALENAFVFTAEWMGSDEEPEVQVFTDWGVDADGVAELMLLQKDVMAGNLSKKTYRAECKRRDVLAADFDNDKEDEQIAEEGLNAPKQTIDPNTGLPVDNSGAPAKVAA